MLIITIHFKEVAFHLPVWSVARVSMWSSQVFRTGSGQTVPARGLELLSSPARVCQSVGIWRVAAELTLYYKYLFGKDKTKAFRSIY